MSDPAEAESPRPSQTSLFLKTAITLAAVGLSLSFLRDLSSIVAPTFLALNLLIVMYPLTGRLMKWHVPRAAASIVTLVAVFVVLALFLWGISYCIAATVQQLSTYTGQYVELYHSGLNLLAKVGMNQDSILTQLKGIDPGKVVSVVQTAVSSAQGGLSILAMLVLALVFIGMDSPKAHRRMESIRQEHQAFADALVGFSHGVRSYWVVSTVFGLIVAFLDYWVLVILGVPMPFVWAILSFLTNYVPNIGFVLGVIPPALIALFDKSWVTAVVVIVAYSVLNFVVQSIIQPKVTGDAIGLTATVSFLSLFVWSWVFGALGALIALPCSVLVKSLVIDLDPNLKWIDALISTDIPNDGDDGSDGSVLPASGADVATGR